MIDLNTISLEQAKSLAYDELVKIENAQKNLQALNQLIAQKQQPQPIDTESVIVE